MTKKYGYSSQKQFTKIMMIFVFPLVLCLAGYNLYSVNMLNSKIAQTNKNMVYIYQESLENEVQEIDYYMADMIANDTDCQQLRYTVSPLDAHLYSYNVIQKFKNTVNTRKLIAGMFIFAPNNNIYREIYSEDYNYQTCSQAEEYLRNLTLTTKECVTWGWFIGKFDDKSYLLRVVALKDVYIICMVDLDRSIKPQNSKGEQNGGILMYASNKGEPLTSVETVKENGIILKPESNTYYFTGDNQHYMVVQNQSVYAKINLVYLVPYYGVFKNLDTVQLTFLVATILIFFLIPLCYHLLRRSFFVPLEHLVETMNLIKGGNLDAKLNTNYRIEELQQVNETFNNMIEQIKALKISVYEKDLERKQTRLQYLQIQIRPHFYLNCMKNLYGLAQEKKYDQIQNVILNLSEYLRYMLQDNFILAPLSGELRSVKNYMLLQQLSVSCPPICNIDVDTQLMNFNIPPLSILTFVENSVKHAVLPEKQLIIYVKASLLKSEEGDFVNITVSDNGRGFPLEMLDKLNNNDGDSNDSEHIGIYNVKHRFSLIYKDKSIFLFSNQTNGACVNIFVPYDCDNNNEKEK